MGWRINTSHPGKLEEFRRYLGDVEVVRLDLREPDADAVTVARYKASQFDGVLVDDTSLFVEGADVGVNVRWLLERLPEFEGRRATFVCLLAIRRGDRVEIFEGRTSGRLVAARGGSFGFNRHFLPDGNDRTFGEEIPDALNPRYLAVQALLAAAPTRVESPLPTWDGPFQAD